MKNVFLFALFLLGVLGIYSPASGTIYRVNNNLTPIPTARLYATLATAQTAASGTAGDTLLVEGSGVEYASLTCAKKLTIIGPGYLLGQNPQSQANAIPATVQGITFNTGSESSSIIGLNFSASSTGYAPSISVNNIAIIRCYLTNGIYITSSVNNLLILQNYIQQFGISVQSTGYAFSNVILKNNIIVPNLSIAQYSGAPRIFSNVENNVFLGNVMITSNTFLSNIIANTAATAAVTASNNQGNLFAAAGQLPTTNNTLVSNIPTLFVGLVAANNSTDGQYRLPAASPYLTAGFGGTQPGIFGGSEPYILSGVPGIPTIYSLRGDAVGSIQNGLNITIGARVNP